MEITQLAFNPPRAPTPQQEEEVVEEEEPVLAASAVETEPEAPVAGIAASSTMSSSFRFIQDSELETPVFEEGAEWIEKADAVDHEEEHAVNGVTPEAAPADVRCCHNPDEILPNALLCRLPMDPLTGLPMTKVVFLLLLASMPSLELPAP